MLLFITRLNPALYVFVHWYRPLNNMFFSVGQSQVSPASVHGIWPNDAYMDLTLVQGV